MPTITRKTETGGGRFYHDIPDAPCPYASVTHILGGGIPKPALINWAANEERKLVMEAAVVLYERCRVHSQTAMPRDLYLATLLGELGKEKAHQKLLAKAGDIGSEIHKLIEWHLRTAIGSHAGLKPIVSLKAQHALDVFEQWGTSVQLKPILIERTVYSHVHQYAGTMDLLARVNGIVTLIDFKSGKAVYPEAFLQSAAYSTALVEMGYLAPQQGLIVRLPKVETDPEMEVVPVPPVADLLPVFLAAKQIWAWSYKNDEAYRARQKAS
jgi:hypothetical protein